MQARFMVEGAKEMRKIRESSAEREQEDEKSE